MACPFCFHNDTRLFLVNVLNRLLDSVELNFNVSVLLSCILVLSRLFSLFLRLLSVLCLVSFISLVRTLVAAAAIVEILVEIFVIVIFKLLVLFKCKIAAAPAAIAPSAAITFNPLAIIKRSFFEYSTLNCVQTIYSIAYLL